MVVLKIARTAFRVRPAQKSAAIRLGKWSFRRARLVSTGVSPQTGGMKTLTPRVALAALAGALALPLAAAPDKEK